MTTASVEPSVVDDNVTRVVEILQAYKRLSLNELIIASGIGKSTLIRRRHAGGWSAAEVARLAEIFEVPVSVFYDGPDNLIANKSQFFRSAAAA